MKTAKFMLKNNKLLIYEENNKLELVLAGISYVKIDREKKEIFVVNKYATIKLKEVQEVEPNKTFKVKEYEFNLR